MSNKVTDSAKRAREAANEKLNQASNTLRETTTTARLKAEEAYGEAKVKASEAYETTKRTAARAGERTAAGIEQNPLAILIGGIAVGVLAGALLPRTDREAKTLGPVGKRIREAASEAAEAAKRAGVETLDSLGVNEHAAKDQATKLVDTALTAASSAGKAAVKTAKDSGKKSV